LKNTALTQQTFLQNKSEVDARARVDSFLHGVEGERKSCNVSK